MRIFVFLIAALAVFVPAARAGEPFFKPGDVVAFVGGEDMVVAAELGYLETLIQLALPDYKLKFRSLAREGDTVFEQRRDLNYPKLEDQLDKIGATVVICQFGQMESLAGEEKLPEFVAAYEKLLARLSGGGKRRFGIILPRNDGSTFYYNGQRAALPVRKDNREYSPGIAEVVKKTGAKLLISTNHSFGRGPGDGTHLSRRAHGDLAENILNDIIPDKPLPSYLVGNLTWHEDDKHVTAPLRQLIAAKNRLWFHYYRPQNWAFLAGDRTNQPSSRDHLDPSKRWFPEELEKFVPLIEAKDAEIWALAKKLK
jgi:hypothetical protein